MKKREEKEREVREEGEKETMKLTNMRSKTGKYLSTLIKDCTCILISITAISELYVKELLSLFKFHQLWVTCLCTQPLFPRQPPLYR